MKNTDFNIALRNYAGIPVVELAGEINKKTIAKLNQILGKLVQAGHYHVMLNVKRADWKKTSTLESLKKVAKMFQAHYGNLNIIAETDQVKKLSLPNNAFRICSSEGQALTRIRKLPMHLMSNVTAMSAHLRETR